MDKSLTVEIGGVECAFEPVPAPGLVGDGDIFPPLLDDLQACFAQAGGQFGPIVDPAANHLLNHVVMNCGQNLFFLTRDLGEVSGLGEPGPGRIVGPAPTLGPVPFVPKRIKVFLPAGRKSVQGLAALKLNSWRDEMQFVVPGVLMPDPQNVVLVPLQPGEGQSLELIH
ncbi:MAG: hypothetical protein ACYDAI_19255 [Trichloromonadaceae bacterium]